MSKKKRRDPLFDGPPPLHPIGQRLVYATGLRYSELEHLRVNDIHQEQDGRVWLEVAGSAERPARHVPVLAGYEQEVLALTNNPPVFGNFQWYPPHWGVQALRRAYARQLYQQCLKTLEVASEPEREGLVIEAALGQVMKALGHPRREVILRDYLHFKEATSESHPPEEAVEDTGSGPANPV